MGLSICSIALADPTVDRGNNDCTTGMHGFHAVTAVGYRVAADCSTDYLIQNSWGDWCPTGQEANCEGNGRIWLNEVALTRNTNRLSTLDREEPLRGPGGASPAPASRSAGTAPRRAP